MNDNISYWWLHPEAESNYVVVIVKSLILLIITTIKGVRQYNT